MEHLIALTISGTPLQAPPGIPTGGLAGAGGNTLAAIRNLLTLIAVIASIIFITLGGIRWIMSSGDPKAVEAARKQITYAVIGLIITLLAFMIVKTLGQILDTPLT